MKERTILLLLGFLLLTAFPSCYIINFEKEVEIEIVFDGSSSRSQISVTSLVNVNDYSSDFREYRDYIEEIEILAMNCWLNTFEGHSGQVITNGTLIISDQYGQGAVVLANLPETSLEQLYLHEQDLILQEPGRQRVEELILTDPNICLGQFTAEVNELPSSFIITFHIKGIIRGSLI